MVSVYRTTGGGQQPSHPEGKVCTLKRNRAHRTSPSSKAAPQAGKEASARMREIGRPRCTKTVPAHFEFLEAVELGTLRVYQNEPNEPGALTFIKGICLDKTKPIRQTKQTFQRMDEFRETSMDIDHSESKSGKGDIQHN
jgi:hypothetical protein